MTDYKHYSFDFWNTLFRSNPEFKKERTRYFHLYLLKKGSLIDGDTIDRTFSEVADYFNNVSKLFGKAPNALEMYAMVIFKLTGSFKNISQLEMELVYKEVEKLFLYNPPLIYDDDTINVLRELSIRGKTLSILSNTCYIRGNTIDKMLEMKGLKNIFSFRLYSDDIGYSKPSKQSFMALDSRTKYLAQDIIHVGDDQVNDGNGATDYGIAHRIINSNSFTIKDLL